MDSTRRLYVRGALGRAARWVLARKGLAAAIVQGSPAVEADLHARHGDAVFPLLEDGTGESARVLGGLSPIVSYLERTYGPPSVFPEDPQKRNQAVTLAEFAEKALVPVIERLAAERGWRGTLLVELRDRLDRVRDGLRRGALDSGAWHLGDFAVAAALVECESVPEIDFARDYADLAAYVAAVRRATEDAE